MKLTNLSFFAGIAEVLVASKLLEINLYGELVGISDCKMNRITALFHFLLKHL